MRGAILLVTALAGCAQQPSVPAGGIVSTNPCADAILVRLVPASRITAISHYSHDPVAGSLPMPVARRFRATAGTAEEVIALRPSLVLTSSFTPIATRDAYARAGLKTLVLGSPTSVVASEAQVMEIATAVGAGAGGQAMVAGIDAAVLAARPASRSKPAALLYIGGELANGSGTLLDEMMTIAGFTNAAASYGLAYTGTLPAETVVARPPAIVIAPPGDGRSATLRRSLLRRTPEAAFDRQLVNCGGPAIVPALKRLAAIRATLP
jgi:iron complex transport system substrate-binding protein